MVEPYHQDCPGHCPPDDANPYAGTLYRAAKKFPPNKRDMLSVIEQGRRTDAQDCRSWGLSVWVDEAAARHAREIVPFFRTCSIVKFTVDEDNGELMHTPSNDQPNHHTYWKKADVTLSDDDFSLFLGPER